MSAQMVDAYLDELLAPLVEDALARSKIQARTNYVVGAPATNIEEAASGAVATTPASVTEPHDARQPKPAAAESVRPASQPAVSPESLRQPTPQQPTEPRADESTRPLPFANRHEETQNRAAPSTSGTRWLRAALGKDRYAFELLRVQEVVRMSPIIALRGTSTAMLGVMNLRGRVVPVFDLAAWLGTGEVEPDEHARIIVVERDEELIGVLVSAVDDVVTLARELIEPPLPSTDPGGVVGIARAGPLPTVLLDADSLFD